MNLSWAMLSALLVKTGTSAARSVDTALRRGVERSLKQHTVPHVAAASSSATDLSKRHYTSETTIPGTVAGCGSVLVMAPPEASTFSTSSY